MGVTENVYEVYQKNLRTYMNEKADFLATGGAASFEEYSKTVGVIQGPDAYSDSERFPNGPWCKEGDWIVMRSYTGTRIEVHGKEFRIINDDSVEAVIEDPRGVKRV